MVGRGTESYQPMGCFHLHFEGHENALDYKRSLDLDTAIAKTSYRIGDTTFRREVFISPVDQVLVVHLTTNGESLINVVASLDSIQKHELLSVEEDIILNGKCPNHVASNFFGDHPKPIQYEDLLGVSFTTRLRTSITGGNITRLEENKIKIQGAKEVTFFLTAVSNFVNYHQQPETPHRVLEGRCAGILSTACDLNYGQIKQRHILEHQRLFKRVKLNLGHGKNSHLPTDQRLIAYKAGAQDAELEALYFQYGRYLLISSSRPGSQPANLQGIWNPYIQPPWNSEYTININTEMNYWLAENCNLSECHEPLFDLIEDLSVIGQRTALLHYNARGWAAHHNVDLWRMTTPTDGEASWAFWPMGGVWLTRHLWTVISIH
jgi:alpha-L-fucosidase 2